MVAPNPLIGFDGIKTSQAQNIGEPGLEAIAAMAAGFGKYHVDQEHWKNSLFT
jgi:hypothetical protein